MRATLPAVAACVLSVLLVTKLDVLVPAETALTPMGRFGNSRLRLRTTGSGLATHLITRYASRMNDKPDAETTNDCIIPPEVTKPQLRNPVDRQSVQYATSGYVSVDSGVCLYHKKNT